MKRKTKNDVIFFVVLIIILLFMAVLGDKSRPGKSFSESPCLVIQCPEERKRFPLNEDQRFSIGTHTVEIREGAVRVSEALCPLKICEKQGWVKEGVIICAPFKTVFIVGAEGKEAYDAISY